MKDDYLWDPSAAPDPDVARIEQMLGRLRTTAPVPQVRLKPPFDVAQGGPEALEGPDTTYDWRTTHEWRTTYEWRTLRFLGPALAAAAAIVAMVGLTWQAGRDAAAWDVSRLDGTPRIGSTPLSGEGRFAVGQTLTTDAASRARIEVSTIGQVDVDGDTRVRLVSTRDGRHQLALERGTLHAIITAPPGQFIVDTPSATATDLGCVYDLHVNDDGSGLLSVVSGWVAFEDKGRESFVPAGASCRTDPTRGPGTPRYDDGAEALRNALDEFDYGGDAARRAAALRFVLDHPDTSAVTLWHLIPRVGAADRGAVVDALADQLPMPPGVTREAILRLDRAALDAWWNELGLGDASWWRKWKGPIPASTHSAQAQSSECPVTPTVRETPPKDPNADPFGDGPWHVNADRTIWVHNWSFPEWRQGLNQKVIWIRPAGAELKISGERLDSPSAPLEARVPCCYPTGFQVSTITFPTAGCWKVTAKAGEREMSFVTNVRPRP